MYSCFQISQQTVYQQSLVLLLSLGVWRVPLIHICFCESIFDMTRKFLLLISLCVVSCTGIGPDGRRWLSVPLPPDPLRECVIRCFEKRNHARVPIQASRELLVPTGKNMFSARLVGGKYEVRGITGPVQIMPLSDFQEFKEQCDHMGWFIQMR